MNFHLINQLKGRKNSVHTLFLKPMKHCTEYGI